MLTCITCSKQLNNGSLHHQEEDHTVAAMPRTKQAIKNLTAQVMILLLCSVWLSRKCTFIPRCVMSQFHLLHFQVCNFQREEEEEQQ